MKAVAYGAFAAVALAGCTGSDESAATLTIDEETLAAVHDRDGTNPALIEPVDDPYEIYLSLAPVDDPRLSEGDAFARALYRCGEVPESGTTDAALAEAYRAQISQWKADGQCD